MARKAAVPAPEKKTVRKPRVASHAPAARTRKPAAVKTLVAFDAAAHQEEIAVEAYLGFLARDGGPGSPEEDWLKAEALVRAKYV